MFQNRPDFNAPFMDVVSRPRGDTPANPEAILQARRQLIDSQPKIEMKEARNSSRVHEGQRKANALYVPN